MHAARQNDRANSLQQSTTITREAPQFAAPISLPHVSGSAIPAGYPSRENRVNQCGSVALSTEAMRGPPWRNSLIIMALLTPKSGYEPGGRGFDSCRARQ